MVFVKMRLVILPIPNRAFLLLYAPVSVRYQVVGEPHCQPSSWRIQFLPHFFFDPFTFVLDDNLTEMIFLSIFPSLKGRIQFCFIARYIGQASVPST